MASPGKILKIDPGNFYLPLFHVIGLLGLLALCLWLSLRPKSPSISVVEFSIPSIDGQSQNMSYQEALSYSLEIENSNKESDIYFDDSILSFSYGQDELAKDRISSFHQGKDSKRKVVKRLAVDPLLWKTFRNAMLNATAELKIGFLTKIRYKTVGIKSKHYGLDFGASLKIGKNGKILGKKKKIKLKRVSKKLRAKAFSHFQ